VQFSRRAIMLRFARSGRGLAVQDKNLEKYVAMERPARSSVVARRCLPKAEDIVAGIAAMQLDQATRKNARSSRNGIASAIGSEERPLLSVTNTRPSARRAGHDRGGDYRCGMHAGATS